MCGAQIDVKPFKNNELVIEPSGNYVMIDLEQH